MGCEGVGSRLLAATPTGWAGESLKNGRAGRGFRRLVSKGRNLTGKKHSWGLEGAHHGCVLERGPVSDSRAVC